MIAVILFFGFVGVILTLDLIDNTLRQLLKVMKSK